MKLEQKSTVYIVVTILLETVRPPNFLPRFKGKIKVHFNYNRYFSVDWSERFLNKLEMEKQKIKEHFVFILPFRLEVSDP